MFSKSTLTAPPDIFRAGADGKDVKALTHENAAWLKDVDFADPQSLTATTASGEKIQDPLIRRPNFDATKKYPVAFLCTAVSGRLGRRVVHALEPVGLGRAGMGDCRAEPARILRLRTEIADQISGDWAAG